MNKKILVVIAILVIIALSCSFTGSSTSGNPSGSNNQPSGSNSSLSQVPVSIFNGLASLNTYALVIEFNSAGPTLAETSHMLYEVQRDNAQDSIYYHTSSTNTTADSEPDTSESKTYVVGNAQCSGSDENGWNYTESTPQETEMRNLLQQMIDFAPLVENPSLVGSETMNGINSNHYTFKISGLGLKSGAAVNANQGEYWLAKDGQYLVKYHLTIETQDTSTQEIMRLEVLVNLTNVNQPLSIVFPAGCTQ